MITTLKEDRVDEVVALVNDMMDEGRYSNLTFDTEGYAAYLHGLLQCSDFRGILYLDSKNRIAGFLLGFVSKFEFAKELRSNDLIFFVRPDMRGSKAAFLLEKTYTEWAMEKGVDKKNIYLGHSNGYDKAGRFFEKVGYSCVGRLYCKTGD
jgi:GNAT superfamily N-acetyltransferase